MSCVALRHTGSTLVWSATRDTNRALRAPHVVTHAIAAHHECCVLQHEADQVHQLVPRQL
jgi:hypothetical protein